MSRLIPSLFVCLISGSLHAQTSSPSSKKSPQAVRTVVFIGDSITAGYGVKREEGYPERVGEILKSKQIKTINGGISGSVTADADKRVRWYLKTRPEVIVLALGGNDGLKGTPVPVIKKNLAAAIDAAKSERVKVLLIGIRVFENLGAEYTKSLAGMFADLAREKKVAFLPFLLEGVALNKSLNQADGKHPNAQGHAIIAKNVAKELEKLL